MWIAKPVEPVNGNTKQEIKKRLPVFLRLFCQTLVENAKRNNKNFRGFPKDIMGKNTKNIFWMNL